MFSVLKEDIYYIKKLRYSLHIQYGSIFLEFLVFFFAGNADFFLVEKLRVRCNKQFFSFDFVVHFFHESSRNWSQYVQSLFHIDGTR